MASVIEFFKVKDAGLDLSIKSVKKTKGHEGELLFSCNVYFGKKMIATYKDEDWGAGITLEVNEKQRALYDSVVAELAKIPEYYYEAIRRNTNVSLEGWANDACIINDIMKSVKREKPRAYWDKNDKSIRVFSKSKKHTDEQLQEHMLTMKNAEPFFKMEDEHILNIYLDYQGIKRN